MHGSAAEIPLPPFHFYSYSSDINQCVCYPGPANYIFKNSLNYLKSKFILTENKSRIL